MHNFFFSFLEIFGIAYSFIFVVLFLKITSMLFHFKGNRNSSCTGPLLLHFVRIVAFFKPVITFNKILSHFVTPIAHCKL